MAWLPAWLSIKNGIQCPVVITIDNPVITWCTSCSTCMHACMVQSCILRMWVGMHTRCQGYVSLNIQYMRDLDKGELCRMCAQSHRPCPVVIWNGSSISWVPMLSFEGGKQVNYPSPSVRWTGYTLCAASLARNCDKALPYVQSIDILLWIVYYILRAPKINNSNIIDLQS